jgi:hypothetical protein
MEEARRRMSYPDMMNFQWEAKFSEARTVVYGGGAKENELP